MVEIGVKDYRLVSLPDSESETPFLIRHRPPGEGLGLPLCDNVLPPGLGAPEGVEEAVVVREAESE